MSWNRKDIRTIRALVLTSPGTSAKQIHRRETREIKGGSRSGSKKVGIKILKHGGLDL